MRRRTSRERRCGSTLSEDVSFLNRASIMRTLDAIPPGTKVEIDATRSVHIDYDVYEILRDFEQRARLLDIDLTVRGLDTLRRDNDAMRRVQARDPQRAEARRPPGDRLTDHQENNESRCVPRPRTFRRA